MNAAVEDSTVDDDAFAGLTAFQRDLLWGLSHENRRKGLGLKSDLEDYYGEELNHSRLYQNLDKLVDAGFVKKSARDRRTNEYALTEAARRALTARQAWQAGKTDE